MKTWTIPFALLVLATANNAGAADRTYEQNVVKMACGEASYTLTSSCIKSKEEFTLNECKPQSLLIENAGGQRRATLPELPRNERKRIQTVGGNLKRLFVVAWACSPTSEGPIASLRYSIGGGSAAYSEAWAYYDKTGMLKKNIENLTQNEVSAIGHHFKNVPSIMPE